MREVVSLGRANGGLFYLAFAMVQSIFCGWAELSSRQIFLLEEIATKNKHPDDSFNMIIGLITAVLCSTQEMC